MKQSTLSKITASVAVAKGMAQRALAASPNPQWTAMLEGADMGAWRVMSLLDGTRDER